MPLSPQALQKKRQKKQHKRSVKIKSRTSELGILSRQLTLQAGDIYDAWVSSHLEDTGIGQVIVSRKSNHQIVMVGFLVDVYCLGVKSVLARQETPTSYPYLIKNISLSTPLTPIDAAYAKKLVLGAVSYAASVGIDPHADYYKYKSIFDDVDAAECLTKFNFGKDGKPFLIAGPHNSPTQIKMWIRNLQNKCGDGAFDYLIEV